jgi:hypothetical protein
MDAVNGMHSAAKGRLDTKAVVVTTQLQLKLPSSFNSLNHKANMQPPMFVSTPLQQVTYVSHSRPIPSTTPQRPASYTLKVPDTHGLTHKGSMMKFSPRDAPRIPTRLCCFDV